MTQQIDPELLASFRKAVGANLERALLEPRADVEACRAEVLAQLAEVITDARKRGFGGRVWLFGSFAWGWPGVRSDIDLIIDGEGADELASAVWQKCNRPVHSLSLDDAPPSLRERVLQDGRPL